MLMKNAVAALMGLAMVAEAASVHQYGTPTRTVGRRQFGKKNNFGNRFGNGQFGGGQNGQNNNNNNNGQNNNGQNNNGQNNNGQNNNNNNNNNNNGGNNNQASETCLAAAALQTGSQSTGQNGAQAADGQVNSATDNANFINFCQGKTLTNGLQNRDGSCNGIPMGEIPSANRMVSTVILNPKNGDDLEPLTTFQIQVNVANMQLGAFTNATSTYYSAPQTLNGGGQIIGHTHVTVQDTGNTLNPTQPLDATVFAFFKGINDAGNGNGQLAAEVTGGLPTGCYRVCTMSSASNHQPVLMPVAQRGSQEDCRYFSVGGACANNNNNNNGGGNNNNNNNNNNNGGNNNNNNNNGGDQGQNNQGQNQGNQGQGNQGQQNNQGNQGRRKSGGRRFGGRKQRQRQ
ncbi:uncharacterized protein PODANS_1_16920 [Podospora anserina S mat+]|uniref:Podospora anserina S mat+ genomic DNA chromosome 1, supercontig 4 n=1 Tax=Podospora anserina (strain S / ATCC MYA-4624 / DSM 980 / FGSC 10383) TaxID=515849 RepID=B2ATT7_PODAN|nr:uncharacterized protein PODANS_1_16920 [Podospora anserina S mat+]CAP67810.1 unnamed protein product [Podospora anserina S mat+]CDP24066.1 Putative protein of unknown function [Podospora anserina S mat+]